MIECHVLVGIGGWKASATVKLVACPHVGDTIEVRDNTVTCDRVHITAKCVYVEQTIRFASEQEAHDYFR